MHIACSTVAHAHAEKTPVDNTYTLFNYSLLLKMLEVLECYEIYRNHTIRISEQITDVKMSQKIVNFDSSH